MQQFVNAVTGVFDQLNPFNLGNLILYFAWLVVFTFTTVAVCCARAGWFRFLCFAVNHLFSVGFLLSWTLTVLLAYTYWKQSLIVLAATAILSVLTMRRRRRDRKDRMEPPEALPVIENDEEPAERLEPRFGRAVTAGERLSVRPADEFTDDRPEPHFGRPAAADRP